MSNKLSNLTANIKAANELIFFGDVIEEFRDLSQSEVNGGRDIIKAHLLKLLSHQRIYWKHRATIGWVKFGDEMTKFFKAKATIKHRHNMIAMLQDENGDEHFEHIAKAALPWRDFKARLGTSLPTSNLLQLNSLIIHHEDLSCLEAPFSKKEIDDVIPSLPSDKSPGPDCFNDDFIKSCWGIICNDFYRLIEDFYFGRVNLQSINASYIILVPKKKMLL